MAFSPLRRAALLLALVASCRADATASDSAGDSSSSRVAKASGPPAFFLQDPTDGLCLSGVEFKRCAIDTLWYVTGKPGAYLLHHRKTDEVEDEECLDRISCTLPEADLRLGNCKHCGAQQWNILGDQEKGYALSQGEKGEHCVQRDGAAATTRACESGYVALQLQFATRDDLRAMESLGARLITAASDGDEKRVKEYLKDGVDVNSRDWDNLTAVVAAASAGHKKLVQLLVREGADVNAMDKDNITALMEASIMGHKDIAELLVKEGAARMSTRCTRTAARR